MLRNFHCTVLFFLFCFCFFLSSAQNYISSNELIDIQEIKSSILSGKTSKYPIHNINGKTYLSFVAKTKEGFDSEQLEQEGCIVHKTVNRLATIRVPLGKLDVIHHMDAIEYLTLAKRMHYSLEKAVKDVRADSVHMGLGGLPQGYIGNDVIVGVTDWGFDYTSPVFYDSTLQQTRILAAWDQYKTSGPSPANFPYGTEYSNPAGLLAAGSDTSNIYSYSTHGTHVACIAGGEGAGTPYGGIAPGVNFLFVTFLVDEGAVLDAWEWMYQQSLIHGKRLVINMSWGLYHAGTLDGNSVLSTAISSYTDLGVVFVNSGGNNGNVNFHLKHNFVNDTINSRINFYSYSAHQYMWGQSIHAWGETGHSFENKLIIKNSAGTVVAESPFYSTSTVSSYVDTFIIADQDTIWYNLSADSAHPLNNRPQMRLRVKCTNTSLRVMLYSAAESGLVHYWNVTELSNDVGNWGMPFTSFGTGSLNGDNENGISEPSCADDVISVAAYATGWTSPGGNPVGGGMASFSSRGPRYDGEMKPDIAAPGVSITSGISSFTDYSFTSVDNIQFNNTTYHFARMSGTSMASPMVAGVVALMLEAYPGVDAREVKNILLQTAREDNNTGIIPSQGDVRWGHGKVNALAAVLEAVSLNGQNELGLANSIHIYPNPVNNQMQISPFSDLPQHVIAQDLSGKTFKLVHKNGLIDCSQLNLGMYFIRFNVMGMDHSISFIKM